MIPREEMKLKLTTLRALDYEDRTGKDIVSTLQEISKTGVVPVRTVLELFKTMGDNYTIDMFDEWEGTFVEKTAAIINAIKSYLGAAKKH